MLPLATYVKIANTQVGSELNQEKKELSVYTWKSCIDFVSSDKLVQFSLVEVDAQNTPMCLGWGQPFRIRAS